VCCLLVLNSVTSTPQWIRQSDQRDMHDVCVIVCIFSPPSSPGVFRPPGLFVHVLSRTSGFSLRLISLRLAVGSTPVYLG
jgi:hypothetical protein